MLLSLQFCKKNSTVNRNMLKRSEFHTTKNLVQLQLVKYKVSGVLSTLCTSTCRPAAYSWRVRVVV